MTLTFSADPQGRTPVSIGTVLNGDPMPTPTHELRVRVIDSRMNILASPNSEAMYRHTGNMPPTFPTFTRWGESLRGLKWPTRGAQAAAFAGVVGLQSSKSAAWFNGGALAAGLWMERAFPNTTSFLWEAPIGFASYPVGATGGKFLSRQIGFEPESGPEQWIQTAGGVGTTAAFYKWLGRETVTGIATQTKQLAMRYVGGPLYAAEMAATRFLQGAATVGRTLAPRLAAAAITAAQIGGTLVTPLIIINPEQFLSQDEPDFL